MDQEMTSGFGVDWVSNVVLLYYIERICCAGCVAILPRRYDIGFVLSLVSKLCSTLNRFLLLMIFVTLPNGLTD